MADAFPYPHLQRSAVFSEDGSRRYCLIRWWSPKGHQDGRRITWVMLNPSSAGSLDDDQTIRKCLGFSNRWGFERMAVVNLFPQVSTDPDALKVEESHTNAVWLWSCVEDAERVVVAWGSHKAAKTDIARKVIRQLGEGYKLYCLGTNADFSPRHPARLPYATPLGRFPWTGALEDTDPATAPTPQEIREETGPTDAELRGQR